MGINYLIIYGERVTIIHYPRNLGKHTDYYGSTTYDDMAFDIYTDGHGNMMALFTGAADEVQS